ncbi:MAG: hypothetical protein PF637_13040 [Spirochaetes bacterium]|nr:hypothetical protein [Spirochaetota bacterium]
MKLDNLKLMLPLFIGLCYYYIIFYSQPAMAQQQAPIQKQKPVHEKSQKTPYTRLTPQTEINSKIFEIYISSSIDLYHFHVLDDENNEKSTHDYTGRKNKIQYSFQPVYLASFEAYAAWNFLQFDGIYKTNRVFKGGGTIEEGNDAVSTITSDAQISEIIGFGVQLFNLKTSFRTVHFNFGEMRVIDAETDSINEKQELLLKVNEADIRYQRPFKIRRNRGIFFRSRFFLGYRYMQYSLPRIVYTFTEAGETDQTDKEYVYKDETEPQEIPFKLHMLGYGIETIVFENRSNLEFLNELAFFFGAGTTKYKLGDNDEAKTRILSSVQFKLKPGLSYKLSKGSLKTSLKLQYEFNLLIPNPVNISKGSDSHTFGQADLYHGLFGSFDLLF